MQNTYSYSVSNGSASVVKLTENQAETHPYISRLVLAMAGCPIVVVPVFNPFSGRRPGKHGSRLVGPVKHHL